MKKSLIGFFKRLKTSSRNDSKSPKSARSAASGSAATAGTPVNSASTTNTKGGSGSVLSSAPISPLSDPNSLPSPKHKQPSSTKNSNVNNSAAGLHQQKQQQKQSALVQTAQPAALIVQTASQAKKPANSPVPTQPPQISGVFVVAADANKPVIPPATKQAFPQPPPAPPSQQQPPQSKQQNRNNEDGSDNNGTTLLETVRSQIEFDKPIAAPNRMIIPSLEVLRLHVQEARNTSTQYAFSKNDYCVLYMLGQGGYGTVTCALHCPSNKNVALKSISKQRMVNKEDRLKCELEIMARVNHRNVLRLLDWGFGNANIYIATEVARGGTLLDRVLNVGSFYEKDAIEATTAIVDALAYLHRMGIVHRDLKLENILLRDPAYKGYSNLVIADFGISRIMSDYDGSMLRTRIGSPGYMAPEVLANKTEGYDKQCDMWSLGVTIFVLLCGKMPYQPVDGRDQELQIVLSHVIAPSDPIWSAISKQGRDFVAACLQLSPEKRLSSDDAMGHPWLTEMEENSITSNDLFELGLRDALETERTRRAAEIAQKKEMEERRPGSGASGRAGSAASSGMANRKDGSRASSAASSVRGGKRQG